MNDPDPFHRFAEFGAGHALPVTIHPTISAPAAPRSPTDMLVVDGVELAPAARLMALAKIRDQHRTASRSANDRMHSAREQIEDRQTRILRIRQSDNGRGSATAMTQTAELQSEIEQFNSARASAQAEVEVAGANWRDAEAVLRAAIAFAREAGAVIPVTLQGEVR